VPKIDTLPVEINITSRLEQYNSNDVTILINYSWTLQDMYSSLYSYQVIPAPPQEIEFVGQSGGVRTQVLYNTYFNVSVTGPCVMNSIVLFYGNFLNL
jgi:hypothetical protein